MKTRRFATLLSSAYLSAMLSSSLLPIAGGVKLAGTVNPDAAQAAYREAVDSWLAANAAPAPTAAPEPQVVIARVAPASEPVMTDELLARLLKMIGEQKEPGSIPPGVCAIFKMCDGTKDLPVRMVQTDTPEGDFMCMKWDNSSADIVVVRKLDENTYHYFLTDKSRKLRAAVLSVNHVPKLVLNETLAKSYEATMAHFAKEAADLPPSDGTKVAGNS